MSDYVRITTSLSAIIAAAQQIGAAAEQFSSDVERLIGDIEALEGDDKLGTDHFGNGFRDNAYHKLVDAGDGGSVQVNQAGKEAAQGGDTEEVGASVSPHRVAHAIHMFDQIMVCFEKIDQYVPGTLWVANLIIGDLPDADPADIYTLADAWGALAQRAHGFHAQLLTGDLAPAVHRVLGHWNSDESGQRYRDDFQGYVEGLGAGVEGLRQIQEAVQSYGNELEMEEFFIFGGSLAEVPLAWALARTTAKEAAEKALKAILEIGTREGFNALRNAISKTALKDALKKGAGDIGRRTASGLVRNLGPRNLIARDVARRAANDFYKDLAKSELRKELRGQVRRLATEQALARGSGRATAWLSGRLAGAAERQGLNRATRDMTARLAADIEKRMVEKFTTRAGTQLAERTVARTALERYVEETAARTSLGQAAAR